jgi:hypothetical protein
MIETSIAYNFNKFSYKILYLVTASFSSIYFISISILPVQKLINLLQDGIAF